MCINAPHEQNPDATAAAETESLAPEDFTHSKKMTFPKAGSADTPEHGYEQFTFQAYAPKVFAACRKVYELEDADVIKALCTKPLKQVGNPGASGSLFFLSADDEYIIKTVSKHEGKFLREFLTKFHARMASTHQGRTLLPKFTGFYKYRGSSSKRKIRFIIMNNLLPTRFSYKYKFDLKGSTFKRSASSKERAKTSPCLKDLDFMAMHDAPLGMKKEECEVSWQHATHGICVCVCARPRAMHHAECVLGVYTAVG